MKNNKGFGLIDLIASIMLVCIMVTMLIAYSKYVRYSISQSKTTSEYNQFVNNKLSETYSIDDWDSLENEVFTGNKITVNVEYIKYEDLTEYSTKKIDIIFELNDKEDKYSLERSIYD